MVDLWLGCADRRQQQYFRGIATGSKSLLRRMTQLLRTLAVSEQAAWMRHYHPTFVTDTSNRELRRGGNNAVISTCGSVNTVFAKPHKPEIADMSWAISARAAPRPAISVHALSISQPASAPVSDAHRECVSRALY